MNQPYSSETNAAVVSTPSWIRAFDTLKSWTSCPRRSSSATSLIDLTTVDEPFSHSRETPSHVVDVLALSSDSDILTIAEVPRHEVSSDANGPRVADDDLVILRSSSIVPKAREMRRVPSDSTLIIDLSLPSAVDAMLPSPAQSTGIRCAVCLDSIGQVDLHSTVCGHVFCRGCITTAVDSTKRCPLCRKRLTRRQIHPLYIS